MHCLFFEQRAFGIISQSSSLEHNPRNSAIITHRIADKGLHKIKIFSTFTQKVTYLSNIFRERSV